MLNDDNEIWKPVENYEKFYEVSNKGRIRNTRNKIMKTYKINSGYEAIKFTVNTKRTSHLIHRLVAKAFLDNPKNLPEVNHINENKMDNKIDNLEWVSSSQNKQHSLKSGTYDKIYTQCNTLGKKNNYKRYSNYHNVTFQKSRNKWAATVRINGKNMFPKRFDTEIEAALHVNWIIDELGLTDRSKNIID